MKSILFWFMGVGHRTSHLHFKQGFSFTHELLPTHFANKPNPLYNTHLKLNNYQGGSRINGQPPQQ